MRLLLNILSNIGLSRWSGTFSSQMQEMMIEGMSAVEARSKLAHEEWLEEKSRLQQLVIYALLCFGLFSCILICLSVAVVATFWDSEYRLCAVWLVVAFWVLCLLLCVARILSVMRQGKRSFKYTKQVLQEDWVAVKEEL
ncbi:MAG: phage holin family protein [Saezia sp.]